MLQMSPLGAYIEAYADRLASEGHCRQSGVRGI